MLVFRMLFNFILPTMPLSLRMLGHNSESIRGSNIRGVTTEREDMFLIGTRRVCGTTDYGQIFFFTRRRLSMEVRGRADEQVASRGRRRASTDGDGSSAATAAGIVFERAV